MLSTLTNHLIDVLTSTQKEYPSRATIYRKDGSYVDVRFGSSPSVVRNVEVIGDTLEISVGDEVLVYWQAQPGRHGKVPVIYVSDSDIHDSVNGGLPAVDGITIDYGASGLHVPRGGIGLENLSFVPALAGHTHRTPLEQFGWNFTNDGIMFSNETYIHPDGQIALGSGDETIKLDSLHATYRLWAGAQDPTSAPFSVTKDGDILASSGVIAGWDIYDSYLEKNNVKLDPSGEITVGSGDDVAVLSSIDANDYALWIGNASPASAPFRVKNTGEVWLDSAHIASVLESTNYSSGLSGWKLDPTGWAEFEDVTIRGILKNVVFQYEPISVISGRIRVSDSCTLIADMGSTDTTMDVTLDNLDENDILQFKASDTRKEWIRVDSTATVISGGYRYTITRDLGSTGAVAFYTGESANVTGNATYPDAPPEFGDNETFGAHYSFGGRSFSSQGGFLTIDGSKDYGPYFGVARRFGADYDQLQDVVRLGLLEGFLGQTKEVYGIAIGDSTQNFQYSYEEGLTIQTRSGLTVFDSEGFKTDTFGLYDVSSAPSYTDGVAYIYMDEPSLKMYVKYKNGANEYTVQLLDMAAGGTGFDELADDLSPALGGDLDLNGYKIDFPSTPNIYDVLDEDDMASDDPSALATQQSIKAYVDALQTNGRNFSGNMELEQTADGAGFTAYGYDDKSAEHADVYVDSNGNAYLYGSNATIVQSNGGAVGLRASSNVYAKLGDASGADKFIVYDSAWNEVLTVKSNAVIELAERSTAPTTSAGFGAIWVKDTTPSTLWYTDDAGTSTQLA